jgi:thiol-disulfide isomerase/thioredoxin
MYDDIKTSHIFYSYKMVARIDHKIIDDVECKWCGKCKMFKSIDMFGNSKQTWDTLHSVR